MDHYYAIVTNDNHLEHYGRKGMKWYEHIFSDKNSRSGVDPDAGYAVIRPLADSKVRDAERRALPLISKPTNEDIANHRKNRARRSKMSYDEAEKEAMKLYQAEIESTGDNDNPPQSALNQTRELRSMVYDPVDCIGKTTSVENAAKPYRDVLRQQQGTRGKEYNRLLDIKIQKGRELSTAIYKELGYSDDVAERLSDNFPIEDAVWD